MGTEVTGGVVLAFAVTYIHVNDMSEFEMYRRTNPQAVITEVNS